METKFGGSNEEVVAVALAPAGAVAAADGGVGCSCDGDKNAPQLSALAQDGDTGSRIDDANGNSDGLVRINLHLESGGGVGSDDSAAGAMA